MFVRHSAEKGNINIINTMTVYQLMAMTCEAELEPHLALGFPAFFWCRRLRELACRLRSQLQKVLTQNPPIRQRSWLPFFVNGHLLVDRR